MTLQIQQGEKNLIVDFTPNALIPGVNITQVREVVSKGRRIVVTSQYKYQPAGAVLANKIVKFTHNESFKRH